MLLAIEQWTWPLGFVIFGYGTFRANIFPRLAGIMMALLGVIVFFLDFSIVIEYFFTALAFATFAWLALLLWKKAPEFSV